MAFVRIGEQVGGEFIPRFEAHAETEVLGGDTYFHGFDLGALLGDSSELELTATADHPDPPIHEAGRSQLRVPTSELNELTPDELGPRYELLDGANAALSFHHPNPLTPRSGGYWFVLMLSRRAGGTFLRFNQKLPNSTDSRYGVLRWRGHNTWHRYKLSLEDMRPIDDWIADLTNGFEISINDGQADSAAKECAFFGAGETALLRHGGHKWRETQFFLQANSTADGGLRRRLITRLTVPASKEKPSPVAARRLGFDDALGVLRRDVRTAAPLDFECAAIDAAGPWTLDWRGVPTGSDDDAPGRLSFRTLWHLRVRHFGLGLRSLRSRDRLSFLPTDFEELQAGRAPWTLRFRVESDWRPRLASMYVEPTTVRLSFGSVRLAAAPGKGPDVPKVDVALRNDDDHGAAIARVGDAVSPTLIGLALAPLPPSERKPGPGEILVNGVLLDLRAIRPDSRLTVAPHRASGVSADLDAPIPAEDRRLGDAPVQVDVQVAFDAGRPEPAGEDPERGAAIDGEWLNREAPLVIDLVDEDFPTIVEATERARQKASHSLQLSVRAAESGTPLDTEAIVLDPSPLRVARVHAESELQADKGSPIAVFSHRPNEPGRWDFQTATGEFDLILPPQATGEEMIKANLFLRKNGGAVPVPYTDRLFDFRLSPPAQLRVDRTALDTARAPAPWSLRRILDRREGEVGLALVRAQLELLYGMTMTIDGRDGGLRIADQDALVGRIPYPNDLLDEFLRAENAESQSDAQRYAAEVATWIRSLLYYPARNKVFRDWADREQLVIDRGVRFELRETRQTAHPIDIEEYGRGVRQEGDDFGPGREPLRGGVDFGFESRNVYEGVVDHEPVDVPGRAQGSVEGLALGTLGGSGRQEALFDEGRTLIITTTTDGNLDALTIVRIGRISMLWNHARHVIVYERTRRTSPRYKGEQPGDFEGLAALRKVKEYVEITQQHRAYPDGRGSARRAGPILGSFFETTVIPVHSSWGYDVKDGFVISLAGPVPEGKERFYPRPNVFLEFARAEGKGGKVSQLIETPERLTFFSSTREGEGSNPDAWIARADVDFPVTRRATAPELSYTPAFEGGKVQPSAQAFDYGQERFTVDVAVGDEAVNLMHGRPFEGLEAKVRNVSLARGLPQTPPASSTVEAKLGNAFGELEAQVGDAVRELALHASQLSRKHSHRRLREVPELQRAGARLLEEAKDRVDKFYDELRKPANKLKDANGEWARLQEEWTKLSTGAWDEFAKDLVRKRLPDVLSSAVSRLTEDTKAEARSVFLTSLDVGRTQSLERIQRFRFAPQLALDRLIAMLKSLRGDLTGAAERAGLSWANVLLDLERRFDVEAPRALQFELHQAIEESLRDLQQLADNVARLVKDGLGPLFPDFAGAGQKGPVQRVTELIAKALADYVDHIRMIEEEVIVPFELEIPDWESLRRRVTTTRLLGALSDAFAQLQIDLREPFERLLQGWRNAIGGVVEDINDAFEAAKKLIPEDFALDEFQAKAEQAIQDVLQGLDGAVGDLGEKLATDKLLKDVQDQLELTEWLKSVAEPVKQASEVFKTEVQDLLDELQGYLDDGAGYIEDLAGNAEAHARRIAGGLRNVGERIESAVVAELRDAIEGAEEGALELVRSLAEGPITDTLRCTREWVGYYYDAAQDALKLTQSAAIFNDLGKDVLNALSTQAPFDRIRDRLLTQLADYDLNKLLPSFAGLKLEHLFRGVKIPRDPLGEYDWIDMRHGFDKSRLRAWSEIVIDKEFGRSLEVFDLSPITLRVLRPRFRAKSRLEAGKGKPFSQKTSGSLSADWVINMNGQSVLTMRAATLRFDETGDLDFDFEAKNLRLAPALQFVTDAVQQFLSPYEGLTITPVAPGGIRAELSLPLPDIGTGAFTMTGITIYSHFELLVVNGFEVSTGLWLSRPDRPFGLAILFLGGGGWFGVDVRYRPPRVFETRVSVGISAGAMVALNFGIARGSAGMLYTVGLDFYRNWTTRGSGDVVISVGMLVWGEFSILGIASAYLRLVMRIEYRNGSMTGYGRVTVRIKICWCFTLEVDKEVRKRFSGGGGKQRIQSADRSKVKAAVDADFENSDW